MTEPRTITRQSQPNRNLPTRISGSTRGRSVPHTEIWYSHRTGNGVLRQHLKIAASLSNLPQTHPTSSDSPAFRKFAQRAGPVHRRPSSSGRWHRCRSRSRASHGLRAQCWWILPKNSDSKSQHHCRDPKKPARKSRRIQMFSSNRVRTDFFCNKMSTAFEPAFEITSIPYLAIASRLVRPAARPGLGLLDAARWPPSSASSWPCLFL